ncbi:MAG: ribosome maturation factor RimM [Actinomycetota bacterium]
MSTFSTTDAQTPQGLLHVGRVMRPHGIRGDVYVSFFTDRPERTKIGARFWLKNSWITVTSARLQPSSWLMHFAGIDDRNAAERISKSDIYGEQIDDPAVMWVHDLIGAEVVDISGARYGKCVWVVDNPAHSLLELESGALVPVVFITERTKDKITINPPEGLFELNIEENEDEK